MKLDPSVKDIPSLIQWLADKHHDGAASAMAEPLGVSISTPNFWKRGVVTPNLENLMRLCEVYGLKLEDVRALTRRKRWRAATPISGGSDGAPRLGVVEVLEKIVPYRTLRDWWRRLLAPPMQPQIWSLA